MLILKMLLVACIAASCQLNAQVKKGQPAPVITLSNARDSLVSLSSFKGKVVLIDFWASWCGPCRASNPKLVNLYEEFKNEDFEIIGISLDENKKAWLQAVKQDGLSYTQLNDASGSGSQVANTYAIYQIPTSYLIDKQGILREKDLNINALKNKIKQLLKE